MHTSEELGTDNFWNKKVKLKWDKADFHQVHGEPLGYAQGAASSTTQLKLGEAETGLPTMHLAHLSCHGEHSGVSRVDTHCVSPHHGSVLWWHQLAPMWPLLPVPTCPFDDFSEEQQVLADCGGSALLSSPLSSPFFFPWFRHHSWHLEARQIKEEEKK